MRYAVPQVYFGLADAATEPFTDLRKFQSELLMTIMFSGHVVIPDVFWFISSNVKRDVLGRRGGVLMEGLRRGLVKPHFRSRESGSFRRALDVIRQQKIIGLLEHSEHIAAKLDEDLSQAGRYRFGYWPRRLVGRSFFDEVQQRLFSDEPPIESDSSAKRVWKDAREWRRDCALEARDRVGDGTLRRGEWLDVVARKAGVWKSTEPIPSAGALLHLSHGAQRKTLGYFLQWVNQCYQLNQADLFKKSSLIQIGKGPAQFASVRRSRRRKQGEVEALDVIELRTRLPVAATSRVFDVKRWMDCRASPEGRSYFRAIDDWRKEPSPTSAVLVGETLQSYAARIRTDCQLALAGQADELVMMLPVLRTPVRRYVAGLVARLIPSVVLDDGQYVSLGLEVASRTWKAIRLVRGDDALAGDAFDAFLCRSRTITLERERLVPVNVQVGTHRGSANDDRSGANEHKNDGK